MLQQEYVTPPVQPRPRQPAPYPIGAAGHTWEVLPHGVQEARVRHGAWRAPARPLLTLEEPSLGLLDRMHEGAVVLKRGGEIVFSNARFAAIVGESPASAGSGHITRFVSGSAGELEALLIAGCGRCRSRFLVSGRGAVEVRLSLAPASARRDRLHLIVTDLSELIDAGERAERACRAKDEFMATLAHELRGPLWTISLAAGVLETNDASSVSARSSHDTIRRQLAHISRLVGDLLDVERVAAGKIHLHREPFDWAGAVRRTIEAVRIDPHLDRQIDVRIDPVWVAGDAVRLEQVVTNVVANAIKYTPPGGRILVSLCAEDGDAVLTVEDSGFGISPSLLPFVFDKYVQSDRTLDRARGGLGIGLALARHLVDLHGGTIAASSGGEGQGSRFTVRLRQVPPRYYLLDANRD